MSNSNEIPILTNGNDFSLSLNILDLFKKNNGQVVPDSSSFNFT